MNLSHFREFESFTVTDSTHVAVNLYLPKQQWDYLRWLMGQGFDLTWFTRACDQRRRGIDDKDVSLQDYVSFATDRLHRAHYRHHPEQDHLVQPVFPQQLTQAIDKAEAYFRSSGPDADRWCGWMTSADA